VILTSPVKTPPQRPSKRGGGADLSVSAKLERLGLISAEACILHLPIRYEDETQIQEIVHLRPGMSAQIEGEVVRSDILLKPRRQLTATFKDQTAEINLRWLTFYPSQLSQMQAGKKWRVRGEVRGGLYGFEMIHPRVSTPSAPLSAALTPVYPTTEGLSQPSLRKAITQALSSANLQDTLPAHLLKKYGLMSFEQSIRILHAPTPDMDAQALMEHEHPAWIRIKFDELLAQQLSLAEARAARQSKRAHPFLTIQSSQSLASQLVASLPFSLTSAQQRVCREISADLGRTYPMYRLLQGDVGSGKTVVAAIAALQAIQHGAQVALMAPTEILAEQHYVKLKSWCEPLGITVTWLAGSVPAKARREALQYIASGQAQLIVGTQALIQDGVDFHSLGLIIVDEQHRFGVTQRLTLSRKGEGDIEFVPHQLTMSATPIPRTLAMTFYADLEVSSIDELPPGRTPIVTKLIASDRRGELIEHVAQAVAKGQQTYWVCPLVEESEALDLQTAVDTHRDLTEALVGLNVGLVHGRLPTAEKAQVMQAFRSGTIDVLVATTVIEVGVDVPNASLMVIEHAERFGLAQLHQLRGRVGRGALQSVCVLLYQTPLSLIARQRLRAMYETQDGFVIAQRDLELRGPGELLGARQSGMALLRFADLANDSALVHSARELATDLRKNSPEIVLGHLSRWMRGRADYLRS